MLKKCLLLIFSVLINLNFSPSLATTAGCDNQTLSQHPHDILNCYIHKQDEIPGPLWKLESEHYDPSKKIHIETYNLISQKWHGILWQHTLVIYRPGSIKAHQALLIVNGGTRAPEAHDNPAAAPLDLAMIAEETQTVVVDLHDVPNQYMTFEDHVPRKEDSIVAYSWNKFMDDPVHNQDWPLHLPMTKAVIKAMDATQAILAEKNIRIDHFVVAGASKRGWATWLTAISDSRTNAIVPIVIDILDFQKNIAHIYAFYNNNWPLPAFHDYLEQGIPARLSSAAFAELAQVEDPISYLDTAQGKKNLAVPKYIISAGRDDFFVPDALNLYINRLPGETEIRIFPEEGHYIDMKNSVGPALLSFYRMVVNHETRPHVQWETDTKGSLTKVIVSQKPEKIQLHELSNPSVRDFRKFSAKNVFSQTKEITNHCTTDHCEYPIVISPPKKGWKSAFVEIYFKKQNGEYLVLTTPAFVMGNNGQWSA